MATLTVCDICGKNQYPIEIFAWYTGESKWNGVETEHIHDKYDVCIYCLSKAF